MKKTHFIDSLILTILKQAESGVLTSELYLEHGMGNSTFYKWRAKYGGMDALRMKDLAEHTANTDQAFYLS